MTEEAAPALAAMLGRHTGLQSLNLSDTALGDDGVAAVVKALHASADSLQVRGVLAGTLFVRDGCLQSRVDQIVCQR